MQADKPIAYDLFTEYFTKSKNRTLFQIKLLETSGVLIINYNNLQYKIWHHQQGFWWFFSGAACLHSDAAPTAQ